MGYGMVELDAAATAIANDVLDRAAAAVIVATRYLDESGEGLKETQQVKLLTTVMGQFDGTGEAVLAELERDAGLHAQTTPIPPGKRLRATEPSRGRNPPATRVAKPLPATFGQRPQTA
jgi:hypothetical protein